MTAKKDTTYSTSHQDVSATLPDTTVALLQEKGIGKPDCAIILGSGLGALTGFLKNSVVVPYSEIPGFPETSVAGHDGALHFGQLGKKSILAWSGRFHFYEGHPFERTILPVRVTKALGCNSLLVTNAAGGINTRFQVGDLMLIDDLLYPLISVSPHNSPVYKRYAADKMVNRITHMAAEEGIAVTRGTYLYAKGPSYETKAEIRSFRIMGADAVGMSTAAELNEALRLDMTCLGISLITNQATGVSKEKLDHGEIKEAATLRERDIIALISRIMSDEKSPIYGSMS